MAIRQPKPQKHHEFPRSRYDGRRMSEAEYLALPEEEPYLEYVDGVVVQKPMPNRDHRILAELFVLEIGLYRRQHGGSGGPEGRVRLPDGTYRLPDTAYWAPGRDDSDDSLPSVAIEVRSPGQGMETLRRKCRAFRRGGVDVCWLIDPVSKTVEVFEGARDGERLAADGVLETGVMPGFRQTVEKLFAALK